MKSIPPSIFAVVREAEVSIHEFAIELRYHDWGYQYSDDLQAYERGVLHRARLVSEASGDADKARLYLFMLKRNEG